MKPLLLINAHRAKFDCLLIIFVASAPTLFLLPRLGFYSDDWAFLARMQLARDQSFLALFSQVFALDNAVRPVQWICLTALYKLCDLHPLGYHIANTILIASSAVLFYLCLRQLGEPHIFVLAVPLLYALLPQYSTDRLWISALQANVSACLFFMSFYADGRAVSSTTARAFWWWNTLAVALILLSGLAYEVFLPLVIVSSVVLVIRQKRNIDSAQRRLQTWKALVLLGANGLAVAFLLAIKAIMASRGQREVTPLAYFDLVSYRMLKAFEISYADHVLNIPFTVWRIVDQYTTWRELFMAGVLGIILLNSLSHAGKKTVVAIALRPSQSLIYAGLGAIIFAAGFSLFPIGPTMMGINNRTAIAASVGVALSLVGLIAWIAGGLSADPTRWSRLFAAGIAAIGVSGFLTLHTVASFWAESYKRELEILAAFKERFPKIPAGTSLMLDGACPYHGPAIIFDTPWDLAGALMLIYDQPDLRADVLHARVQADERGLMVASYWTDELYPYKRLWIYHFGLRQAYPIRDAAAARAYLENIRASLGNACSPGEHGSGAQIPGMSLRSVVGRLLRTLHRLW